MVVSRWFAKVKKEWKILGKRPMCWLAVGFLLIICIFLMGRSYKEIPKPENDGSVYLEGRVADKQYKESGYGGYWQVTLKGVKVLKRKEKESVQEQKREGSEEVREESGEKKKAADTEALEGKYLCQVSDSSNLNLKIGQMVLFYGTYTPWEEPGNPGQFDAGKYYCSQGILGQFKKCKVIKQGVSYSKLREGLWKLRQTTNLFLQQELGADDGGLIAAMLLGEKSGLNEEDKSLYQRNGISHILAISGLHLMLLGMGVFRILKMILGSNKGVAVISIIIMSVYCVFTGNSISTIRATIMFALSLTAGILGRSYDSLSALGVAAMIQLFVNPYVINNSGFWLSFLAVIGVTFVAPGLQKLLGAKKKIGKSLCVSVASSITTLPVILCNYGTYPWYSILLNLFILPAMSVLLFLSVVLVGLSFPSLLYEMENGWEIQDWLEADKKNALDIGLNGTWASGLMQGKEKLCISVFRKAVIIGIKLILKYFEVCCNAFEYSPLQDGYLGAPSIMQIIIYGVLVIAAISGLVKHSVFGRKMILLAALMILTLRFDVNAEVTMLDVGQGDSIVIQNQNGNVYIFDCGSSSVSKVGKYRLLPFLKYKGYGRIKGIFISHLDEDHLNGIVELLEQAPEERIKIEYLFLPESATKIPKDKELVDELQVLASRNKIKMAYLKQGDKIRDGSMEFLCLHPRKNSNGSYLVEDRNDQSLVLWMKYYDFDMLLTGDVENIGEREILENMELMGLEENWSLQEENRISRKQGEVKQQREVKQQGEVKQKGEVRQQEEVLKLKCGSGLEVLKVAHHGSSGSSSEEFLETFYPMLSLISCGKNNSYGHPHVETLERLEAVGSEVISTVDNGAITMEISGKSVRVKGYKH